MQHRSIVDKVKKENAELRCKYDLLVQQLKPSEEEGGAEPEIKHGLYVQRTVQAEAVHLGESVLSPKHDRFKTGNLTGGITRSDAFDTNNTNMGNPITSSGVMTAGGGKSEEVIKDNVDGLKTERSSLPYTQTTGAEQERKKVPEFSMATETQRDLNSNSMKTKQKKKTKCSCH
ncbi:unnamed protein product [Phytomonas sp. Hart1]|nr:unnamed protein product [Phytomonas sp. Hart1]|eukprot:CCW69656.1 unnamed protein product [Phytomonas sp. isolate Hart1]